jgi:hypothetical protein
VTRNNNLHIVIGFILELGVVKTVVILPQAKSLAYVEQELFTLLEHTSSPPVFREFRVLDLCVFEYIHCNKYQNFNKFQPTDSEL